MALFIWGSYGDFAREPKYELLTMTNCLLSQKLAGNAEKLDDWEPVRVPRKPGEPDGTFD